MKQFLTLIILFSSFTQAQVYEVLVETKHNTKYTPEYIEKIFGNSKDEITKWNIEQNSNPPALDYKIYSSNKEQNSIEQEKINNEQGNQGEIKKSVPGLPFGLTYSDFNINENYRNVDVYGKNYIVKVPIEDLVWNYTEETKEILGYKTYKATAKYNIYNNEYNVEAWFTKDINFDFMPISVKRIKGFVLEITMFIELKDVGKMTNLIKVQSFKKTEKKYTFKNPLKADKKSKLPVVSLDELDKIYDEANNKRNEMYNNSQGIDKK